MMMMEGGEEKQRTNVNFLLEEYGIMVNTGEKEGEGRGGGGEGRGGGGEGRGGGGGKGRGGLVVEGRGGEGWWWRGGRDGGGGKGRGGVEEEGRRGGRGSGLYAGGKTYACNQVNGIVLSLDHLTEAIPMRCTVD